MAFVPIPDTAQVTILQTLHGEEVANVLHFTREGGYDLPSLTDLASGARDNWKAFILPLQASDLVMDGVRARNMAVQDGFQVEVIAGAGNNGGVAGLSLPGNVAFCITHRTALIGRSRRGRTYLAGISKGQVTSNTIAAPVATDMVTAFNNFRIQMAQLGFAFVVASRFTGNQPRPFGVVTLVLQSTAVDLRVDSQRGRLSS